MQDLSRIASIEAAGDAPALVTYAPSGEIERYTYAELESAIGVVASGIRARDIPAGVPVALIGETSASSMIASLAVMRAGCVLAAINHKLPLRLQAEIAKHTECAALIYTEQFAGRLPEIDIAAIPISTLMAASSGAAGAATPPERAMIMFTSGSSGEPKGTPLTHEGYLWAMERFNFLKDVISGEAVLVAAPLFHMNGQFHTLSVLMLGGMAVLLPEFDASGFLAAAEQYQAARLTGVPTMFELCVRLAEAERRAPIECVRSVGMGSAPFSKSLLDRLQRLFPNAAISNGYGATEIGPATFGPHPEGAPTPKLSIGYPMSGVDVELRGGLDENHGELFIRTGMQTEGYLRRPDATRRAFQDGWYATGDLMRRDSNGFFYFDGRTDDMFVSGGENIHPLAVEAMLIGHEDILQAAIVPIDDPVKGAVPVAFVVGAIEPDAVKRHALKNGPAYAHPRFVEVLSEMPLSGANKIDKKALRARAEERFGGRRP